MKPLLLIDLDGTLFKTYDFWQDFCFALSQVTGRHPKEFKHSYGHYSSGTGRTLYIDFDRLIAETKVATPVLLGALAKIAKGKSYLFDDAKQFVDMIPNIEQVYDISVLTFGQPFFQQLKIDHTPEINHLTTYITQGLKNQYIQEHFSDRNGALVDDKPGQELPEGWLEVTIDRSLQHNQPPIFEAQGIVRISTLADAISVIYRST